MPSWFISTGADEQLAQITYLIFVFCKHNVTMRTMLAHSLKLKSCVIVAETLTKDEQKELARVTRMIAHGVQACDTVGLELIPFVACVRMVDNLMTPYRDWMRILQAWDALPKQTILIETYDSTVIKVFSKHPTLSAAIFHDNGPGPRDVPVEHFRRLVDYNVKVYYDGVELKTAIAEKIALTPDN
jgi:hypothetical protein